MFAVLIGAQVAAGLLLRGGWDLWAQSAVLLLLIAGFGAWLVARVVHGRIPLPSWNPLVWALVLALASLASAWGSPVAVYSLPSWAAAAAGLWLFPAATLLSSRDRVRVEQFLRVAAWVLVLLAFYQRLHGDERPPSALLNQNAFAGAILLLLPVAARRGDALLAAGLVLCLWWTRSVGAWLGLSAALLLNRRTVGSFAFWSGAVAGFAGLVAAYAKLQSPQVLHRWTWWKAAWDMARSAPWRGLGPGAFPYVLPAHIAAKPELFSLFAHQHFLETAAEKGWPYLFLWSVGLIFILRRARPGLRFGPVAALVHGLFDYALGIPGVFWLFCLSTAWALPESADAAAVRAGRKVPIAALVFAVAVVAVVWIEGNWRADRLRAQAFARISSGAGAQEAERTLAASETLRPHPEAARWRAELALSQAAGPQASRRLEEAAVHLERAVSLDPYRSSNWDLLEGVYRRLGRAAAAADARMRKARIYPTAAAT